MKTFNQACVDVISECPDPYAKAYAAKGLTLRTNEERRVQSLYILNNLDHWRGDLAKETRLTLKYYGEEA